LAAGLDGEEGKSFGGSGENSNPSISFHVRGVRKSDLETDTRVQILSDASFSDAGTEEIIDNVGIDMLMKKGKLKRYFISIQIFGKNYDVLKRINLR